MYGTANGWWIIGEWNNRLMDGVSERVNGWMNGQMVRRQNDFLRICVDLLVQWMDGYENG